MKKIVCVTGGNGCGKTHKAKELAAAWKCPHIETSDGLCAVLANENDIKESVEQLQIRKSQHRERLAQIGDSCLSMRSIWYALDVAEALKTHDVVLVSGVRRFKELVLLQAFFWDAEVVELCIRYQSVQRPVVDVKYHSPESLALSCGLEVKS